MTGHNFLTVVYAEMFPEDQVSAYSHYRLWESLGYILVFCLKLGQVNVAVIIYIVIIVLAAGNFRVCNYLENNYY